MKGGMSPDTSFSSPPSRGFYFGQFPYICTCKLSLPQACFYNCCFSGNVVQFCPSSVHADRCCVPLPPVTPPHPLFLCLNFYLVPHLCQTFWLQNISSTLSVAIRHLEDYILVLATVDLYASANYVYRCVFLRMVIKGRGRGGRRQTSSKPPPPT